jgi:hypothetical protein
MTGSATTPSYAAGHDSDTRPSAFRVVLVVSGLAALVLAAGFLERAAWATDLWPWEEGRLSHTFLASILVAIAMPVLWIGATGEIAAVRAGALDLAVTYGGMFLYILTRLGDSGQPGLAPYAVVFGVAALGMVATFLWARRVPWSDSRAMPAPVRFSFAAFVVLLIGFGTALILHADVFPWSLGRDTSVMFGLIYLGASVYFIHGIAEPRWPNAQGQLLGFLAYDIVLIGPFIEHLDDVSGGELTSLVIYTGFVAYSGLLAVYYLFVRPPLR